MLVGSKDESSGNQSARFDYVESNDKFTLSIRTPYALEERLGGEYIRIDGLNFKYGKHEIIESISPRCYKVATKKNEEKWATGYSAVTLRFYWKNNCWYVAATTDVNLPDITSEYLSGNDNLIVQLELFEAGVIPVGNDVVSPALAACFPPAGSGEPEG